MAEILIVEDERICARQYADLFFSAGYAVRLARTAAQALAAFVERVPDVVLLDIMLPKGDGFQVCAQLRARDAFVPIVFNTALEGTADKLKGLELGGDDYVLKTDPPEELLARVARAVRRHRAFLDSRRARNLLRLGRVTVDLEALELADGAGRLIRLTRTEADILRLLDEAGGELVTANDLIDATRGEGFVCDENTVYVHLANLRRKLGPARDLLVTERGAGYRLMR